MNKETEFEAEKLPTQNQGESKGSSKTDETKDSKKSTNSNRTSNKKKKKPVQSDFKPHVWFHDKIMYIGYKTQNNMTGSWTYDSVREIDMTHVENDVFALVKESEALISAHLNSTTFDRERVKSLSDKVDKRIVQVISKFNNIAMNLNKSAEKLKTAFITNFESFQKKIKAKSKQED